jgi:hypothetical protein
MSAPRLGTFRRGAFRKDLQDWFRQDVAFPDAVQLGQETGTSIHSSTKPARNLPDFRHGQRTAAGGTTEFFTARRGFHPDGATRLPEKQGKMRDFKKFPVIEIFLCVFLLFIRSFKGLRGNSLLWSRTGNSGTGTGRFLQRTAVRRTPTTHVAQGDRRIALRSSALHARLFVISARSGGKHQACFTLTNSKNSKLL